MARTVGVNTPTTQQQRVHQAVNNFLFHNTNTYNAQFYANFQYLQQTLTQGLPPSVARRVRNNAQANQ